MPEPSHPSPSAHARITTLAVGVVAFMAYAWTVADTVQGGDAGEFMVLGARGGVAHPPGYPLYVLWCRLWAALPWGSVAWRTSVGSAMLAAVAMALLHDGVARITRTRLAALLVTLTAATAPTWWRYANVAEVFALHGLVTCAALNVAMRVQQGWQGTRALLCMGGVLAVGVAHHHTVIALAPLACFVAWKAAAEPTQRGRITALAVVGGTAASGLAAYLLLLDPEGAFTWGATNTWDGLVHHVLRRDYGTFSLSPRDDGAAWWSNPAAWLQSLPRAWLWAYLLALAPGWRAAREFSTRAYAAAVGGSAVLAGPVLLSAFNIPPENIGLAVVERFYVMPTLLLAPLVALGTDAVLLRLRPPPTVAATLVLATALAGGMQGVEHGNRRHITWLEDHVVNALSTVEQGALVVGHGDDRFFGFLYAQQVLGLRPDVTYVDPGMFGLAWYREQLAARGLPLAPVTWVHAVRALAPRRPVYIAHHYRLHEPAVMAQLPPVYPETPSLLRVSPDGTVPARHDLEPRLARAVLQLQLRSTPSSVQDLDERWEGEGFRQYGQAFKVLRDMQAAAGDVVGAERAEKLRNFWLQPWTWEHAVVR